MAAANVFASSRERRTARRARRKAAQTLEYRLMVTAVFCLLAGGAVMVYSASSARTLLAGGGDGTGYLVKYVAYGAVGVVCMQVLARHGLSFIRNLTRPLLYTAYVLLLLVLMPGFGVHVNGASRWLGFGPLVFQPSEVMKLALILHAADVLDRKPKLARELRFLVPPLIGPMLLALALVMKQPDLGTALVISMCVGAMMIAAGVPIRQLGLVVGAGVLIIGLLVLVEPYRRARLTSFLHPFNDPGGAGFQAAQGQIAIGSGGMLGLGPGQSVQKLFYLPEAHTDFIMAVIGEELGVVGISVLLMLYGMIGYAGLRTARAAKGAYGKLLAAGLTSLILCQALLNTYAVLGLAPLTGVPLPFISSGSTSLIVMLCAMGLLLNIASGGQTHIRAVREPRDGDPHERDAADRDRRRRDRGSRGPGAGGRRRAAG